MLVTGLPDLCLPGLSVGRCQGEISTAETYQGVAAVGRLAPGGTNAAARFIEAPAAERQAFWQHCSGGRTTPTSLSQRSGTVSAVYVIELLDPRDHQTGSALYEGVIHPQLSERGLLSRLVRVPTNSALVPALQVVLAECREHALRPILHLETHGSREGLGNNATSPVTWATIVPVLRDLNRCSKFNLVVTLAACHGASLVAVLDVNEPAPLLGLIGPACQILPSTIEAGFSAFYRVLIQTLDLDAAFASLQACDALLPEAWHFYSAEWYFELAYGYFIEHHLGSGGLGELERFVVKGARRRHRREGRLTKGLRGAVRNRIRGDQSTLFEEAKARFFMLGEFPDHACRFPVTEAGCRRAFDRWRAATPTKRKQSTD